MQNHRVLGKFKSETGSDRDMVYICIVVSVSQGCAFHIHYAAALHRVNNTN